MMPSASIEDDRDEDEREAARRKKSEWGDVSGKRPIVL
jgi:hypothetical protein